MYQTKTSQWVRDTEKQTWHGIKATIDKQLQDKINYQKEHEADCIFVEDDKVSPANEEAQQGKPLTPEQLEIKLKSLNKNLYFIVNPHNHKMKALYFIENNTKRYICSYHNEIMPEHSVVKLKTEMVWDPNQTIRPLERPDNAMWVAGKGFEFDDSKPRPGWKKIKKPNGELKRGWRTVLLKCILEKLITTQQAEKAFGQPSSAFGQRAWAFQNGKLSGADIDLPW